MKLLRNILIALVLVIVLLFALGAFLVNNWTRGPLPQHDGTVTIASGTSETSAQGVNSTGLHDTIEIYRDDWGVPHIYASNAYDLFFAQGYTQAQDRWWQMEFSRHTGRGSIQELTGKSDAVMSTDLFIRKAGWLRSAEQDLANANPAMVNHLQAFADGVNAYIFSRPQSALALEYNILSLPVVGVNIELEPWTPLDTLVWTRVMSWSLSGNAGDELTLSELLDELGQAMVDDFAPPYPFGTKTTILQAEDLPISDDTLTAASMFHNDSAGIRGLKDDHLTDLALFTTGEGIGSNNWVVSGAKTDTGMPLLANDPHLGIGMPSIWYEVGLHCQPVSDECPFNVVGFTFPASPAVIIGHNATIAWGVTNVSWDTQDYYMIKVNPDNPLQYEWNGEWRDMEVVDEVIRFGDSDETVPIQVRITHLGPIMNDNTLDDDGNLSGFNNENPRALKWTANEPGTLFEAIIKLNIASNWEEFREAASLWDSPSQNMVYADTQGNIGYQTPGKIPVRAPGHTGLLPVDGSTDQYEWRGYVPFDDLPRILNPSRGYIATANQALVPLAYYEQLAEKLGDAYGDDAHYVFGYQWAYGYRGQRIMDLLEAQKTHSISTFQEIHGDNKMVVAEEIADTLSTVDMGDDSLNEMRDWMLDWDYLMNMDSPQAALFGLFWGRLMDNLYNDQLDDIAGASGGGMNMWSVRLLMDDSENVWWDDSATNAVETRDDIIQRSFAEAVKNTKKVLGEDREQWQWGTLHTATFVSNPLGLSGIDLIEGMVNSGPHPTGGGPAIVNATGWSDLADGDASVVALPSMRMIVDMENFDNSLTIHTTGQSGHPFSEHYADMIDMWRNIEYKPMLFSRESVESAAVSKLMLTPDE